MTLDCPDFGCCLSVEDLEFNALYLGVFGTCNYSASSVRYTFKVKR